MGENQDEGGQNQLEEKDKHTVKEPAVLKIPPLHAVDSFFDSKCTNLVSTRMHFNMFC